MINIEKTKKELTAAIFDHINLLDKEQLIKQRKALEKDIQLISTPNYFKGNCNDLLRIRYIELNYIDHLLK